MGRIQVLDDHLANQIAAGEVVERPASIVKELAENAIDAKADRIHIRIEEGGISLIQVSDNGIGMDKEDAVLAFSRHATSKIKREKDLFSIRTLGFRGEALPSIASVARVSLTTSHDPAQPAVTVRLEGGEWISTEETGARSRGTDVTVKDLFFNTPARLKYLKTVNTEVSHVADVVGRLALAHPHISFALSHHQRELFRTAGDGKLLHVLHALYGKQVASRVVPFEAQNLDFRIRGFVSKPEITRASRSYLSIILNGRYVRSVPISQAILRAYGTLLPSGRYPIGVLHMEMDPKLLDVNVHPAKLEVRLSKEKECCQLVEEAIKKAFGKERFVPGFTSHTQKEGSMPKPVQESLRFEPGNRSESHPIESPYQMESPLKREQRVNEKPETKGQMERKDHGGHSFRREYRSALSAWTNGEPEEKRDQSLSSSPSLGRFAEPEPVLDTEFHPPGNTWENRAGREVAGFERSEAPSASLGETMSASETGKSALQPEEDGPNAEAGGSRSERMGSETGDACVSRLPSLLPLAQIHGTYIVAQSDDGFYLIDQHAAHERIYYEKFSRKLGEENKEQVELLIPLTIECSPSEAEVLQYHLEQLNRWGLDMEPFGGTTFIIRAYPIWFPREDAVQLVHEIIEWLREHGKVDTAQLRDASAKMMSCKAAIKANRHLRRDEMEALLQSLGHCENPFTCPHGRPIFVHFSTYELEKMFKRVM